MGEWNITEILLAVVAAAEAVYILFIKLFRKNK